VLGAVRSSDPIAGATAIINIKTEDIRERAFELADGKGVNTVFDTVGGAMFETALRSLRPGGRHVAIAIASTGDKRVSFDLVDFYHNSSQRVLEPGNQTENMKRIMSGGSHE